MRPASSEVNPFIDAARDLALQAATRLMELRLSPLQKTRKADHSLVTNADHEADRIIRNGLREAFPDHAILTEESVMDGHAGSEYVWVVDPLDGTRAYVNGTSGFSVMIGLLRNGVPYAGVVVDPWEGRVYEAMKGEGTFHTALSPTLSREGRGGSRVPSSFSGEGVRERVHVSNRQDLAQMPIITSTGFPEAAVQAIKKVLPGPWVPAVNSVGVKVGFVVRQLADIYINHHSVHYWDTCAPQVILEEAGGVISFLDGRPLTYALDGQYRHAGPTLATNNQRHAETLAILGSIL